MSVSRLSLCLLFLVRFDINLRDVCVVIVFLPLPFSDSVSSSICISACFTANSSLLVFLLLLLIRETSQSMFVLLLVWLRFVVAVRLDEVATESLSVLVFIDELHVRVVRVLDLLSKFGGIKNEFFIWSFSTGPQ